MGGVDGFGAGHTTGNPPQDSCLGGVGVQERRSLPADEGYDLEQGEEIVQRGDIAAQVGEGVIGNTEPLRELPGVFFRLLRRTGGHNDLYALFREASDQLEEYSRSAALIESGYQL